MLRKLSDLRGSVVEAADGDAGVLKDLYFDSDSWVVHLLGVDIGNTPPGRLVMLPTAHVLGVYLNGFPGKAIAVNLTKQQVQDYPPIGVDSAAAQRRGVAAFRDQTNQGSMHPLPRMAAIEPIEEPALLSAAGVSHDDIAAQDGELGRVKDLAIDDRSWRIHYLIVDTRKWWPGKKVLLDAHEIGEVDAAHAQIHVKMSRDGLRRAREYDPSVSLLW